MAAKIFGARRYALTHSAERILARPRPARPTPSEDYQPWPRVPVTCLRCRHLLANCICFDEYFARSTS